MKKRRREKGREEKEEKEERHGCYDVVWKLGFCMDLYGLLDLSMVFYGFLGS